MTGERWRLVHYICPSGYSQVYEFLRDLRTSSFEDWHVFDSQRRPVLEEFGIFAGSPYWEKLGGGLAETKWNGKDHANLRIYGSAESDRRLVMYYGVPKRWKGFSHRDLCDKYRADFLSADYDEEKRELLRRAYYKRREKK